jgi:CubicO group peptidase (beta-lactamase class C family)
MPDFHKLARLGLVACILVTSVTPHAVAGQECPPFPLPADAAAAAGWAPDGLAALHRLASMLDVQSMLILTDGREILRVGDIDRVNTVHSIRKSLLSALIGQEVAKGVIDLQQPIGTLSVGKKVTLLSTESQATIENLLTSQSGIYLPAAGDTDKANLPTRGRDRPGLVWVYSNWGFNALGAVYGELTGRDLIQAFNERVAKPLCMGGGKEIGGAYQYRRDWLGRVLDPFPAYHLRLTARDLARFGQMYLQAGWWNGQQIVPSDWVNASTGAHAHTDEPVFNAYGYLWWVVSEGRAGQSTNKGNGGLPMGSFAAAGYGGHWLIVVPAWRSVIVTRMNTDAWFAPTVLSSIEREHLLRAIIRAHRLPKSLNDAKGKDSPPEQQDD